MISSRLLKLIVYTSDNYTELRKKYSVRKFTLQGEFFIA